MPLIALIAPASVAFDAVAPPFNTPIRQTSEQVRDDGRTRRSFRITRTLLFAKDVDGVRLTVTLTSATADADPIERARYRTANAPLTDRPIVIRLDRDGAVRSVDDLPGVWRAWTAGLTAAAPGGRDPGADALRARLDAIAPPQRQAMVGSIAEALFAPAAERMPAPPRPVTIASPPPFAGLTLAGTITATADAGGVRVRTSASGRSPGTGTSRDAAITIVSDRLVDPASGLILSWERRETLAVRGARLVTTTITRLTW